jgi:hypothetical protein
MRGIGTPFGCRVIPTTLGGVGFIHFDPFTEKCQSEALRPINKIVVFHTSARRDLIDLVCTSSNTSLDLAFEHFPDTFRMCRAAKEKLEEVVSLAVLRRWTPIVKCKPGGEKISWSVNSGTGPPECRHCRGVGHWALEAETHRLEMWKSKRWQGYREENGRRWYVWTAELRVRHRQIWRKTIKLLLAKLRLEEI